MIVAAPVLGVAMVVGLLVGLLQAITSIQEQTLAFVPKFVAISTVIVLLGGWMIGKLVAYTAELFLALPQYGAM
jgi:flagellar biosynthetic protein FliQ